MKTCLLAFAVLAMSVPSSAQWIDSPLKKDPWSNKATVGTPNPGEYHKYFRLNKPNQYIPRNAMSQVKHRIDSIVANVVGSQGNRYIYDYTGVGNPTSETSYYPGYSNRRDFTYDINGLTMEWLDLSYNSGTSTWTNTGKVSFSYTATGNRDSLVLFHWDTTTSLWRKFYKIDYSYDANDNLILQDEFTYDTITNQWVIDKSTAIAYNAQNLPTLETRSVSNGLGGLTPDRQFEYYYNQGPTAFPDSVLDYVYNSVSTAWQLQFKSVNVLLNAATGDYYTIYSNLQGAGTWVPSSKEELYWDGAGNLIELISFYPSGTSWVNYNRFTWTFNNTNLLPDLYVTNLYQYSCMVINQKNYFWTNNQWSLNDSTDYYWSGVSTGIEDSETFSFSAFPNPAQNELTVNSMSAIPAMIRVTDITGKLLTEQPFESTVTLDVAGFSKGLYLWHITQENKTASGKFVKE